MNAVNQVALKVNEKGLVNGLQHAFTTKTSLFKELLQNGDRAGATEILVFIEEDKIGSLNVVITDNGCGISDMGMLLSIAESGWSEDVMAVRHPYGMGFLSALYATSAIEVESRGSRMSFNSVEALSFNPVVVEPHSPSRNEPGTRLVLHGLKLKLFDATSAVREFAKGFPIRVFLNGEEIERKHALDNSARRFIETDIGMVSIPGFETGNTRTQTRYYLQGFLVYKTWVTDKEESNVVVHLDPTKFSARMPDRDVLIDQEVRIKEVDQVICSMWRDVLSVKKAEIPAAEFIDMYWNAINSYAKDCLNDIPLLPRQVISQFTEMPYLAPDWESFQKTPEIHLAMNEVIDGQACLVELDGIDDESVAAWNYAYANKSLEITSYMLDKGHWAQAYIRRVEVMATQVVVRGQYEEGFMNGTYLWSIPVVLCESFDILVENENGEWTDSVAIDDLIIYDGKRFLVPRKADASGWAVQQACNYMDEHENYLDEKMESDQNDLQRKIQELRGLPPEQVLKDLFVQRSVSLSDYPSLMGRSFVLTVDPIGSFTVVEHLSQQ